MKFHVHMVLQVVDLTLQFQTECFCKLSIVLVKVPELVDRHDFFKRQSLLPDRLEKTHQDLDALDCLSSAFVRRFSLEVQMESVI